MQYNGDKYPSFITEYVNRTSEEERMDLSEEEYKHYIYGTLNGLDEAHSRGIMHRDIKPENLAFDRATKQLKIIDYGLGGFYRPYHTYALSVASRYYRPPELFIGIEKYHYSLDIWAVGVTLASFVFQMPYFIKGSDDHDQLVRITKIFGTADLEKYALKYNIDIYDEDFGLQLQRKIPLTSFINQANEHLATPEALDLIEKMLVIDHSQRITASEAMKHPYFKSILQ